MDDGTASRSLSCRTWCRFPAPISTRVRSDPPSARRNPFRAAIEEREALDFIFKPIRKAAREFECQRAILVGHNAAFDLNFLNAAIRRTGHKRSPFHLFSCFDTATLAGLAYGQTVLSRAVQAAGFEWNASEAHCGYDAERKP